MVAFDGAQRMREMLNSIPQYSRPYPNDIKTAEDLLFDLEEWGSEGSSVLTHAKASAFAQKTYVPTDIYRDFEYALSRVKQARNSIQKHIGDLKRARRQVDDARYRESLAISKMKNVERKSSIRQEWMDAAMGYLDADVIAEIWDLVYAKRPDFRPREEDNAEDARSTPG